MSYSRSLLSNAKALSAPDQQVALIIAGMEKLAVTIGQDTPQYQTRYDELFELMAQEHREFDSWKHLVPTPQTAIQISDFGNPEQEQEPEPEAVAITVPSLSRQPASLSVEVASTPSRRSVYCKVCLGIMAVCTVLGGAGVLATNYESTHWW